MALPIRPDNDDPSVYAQGGTLYIANFTETDPAVVRLIGGSDDPVTAFHRFLAFAANVSERHQHWSIEGRDGMDLTRDQPIPVYYQLKTLLTEEILSGVYGADGRLPTEHQLCERFGVSRTPVIHALGDLAAEGVVLRRRRFGTFVNPCWLARRAAGDGS